MFGAPQNLSKRRIRAVIPERQGRNTGRCGRARVLDQALYRRRNAVERCVGWLKGCRAVATRHDKLAVNFAALISLACLRLFLRRISPSDET
jgi:transposase